MDPRMVLDEQTTTMPALRESQKGPAEHRYGELSTDPHTLFAGVQSVIPEDDDDDENVFTKQLIRSVRSDTSVTVPRSFAPTGRGNLPPLPNLPQARPVQYTLPPVPVFPRLEERDDVASEPAPRPPPTASVPAPRPLPAVALPAPSPAASGVPGPSPVSAPRPPPTASVPAPRPPPAVALPAPSPPPAASGVPGPSPLPAPRLTPVPEYDAARAAGQRPSAPAPAPPPGTASAPEPEALFEVFDPRKQPSARRPGYVEAYAPWPQEPPAKSEALITFAKGWGPPPRETQASESVIDLAQAVGFRRGLSRLFGPATDARRYMLFGFAAGLVGMIIVCVVALTVRAQDARTAEMTRTVAATDDDGYTVVQATVFVDGVARCFELPCTLTLERQRQWLTVRSNNHESPPARLLERGAGPAAIHLEMRRSKRVLPPLPPELAPKAATAQPPTLSPAAAPRPPAPVAAAPVVAPTPQPTTGAAPARAVPVAAAPAPAPAVVKTRPVAKAPGKLNINSIPASHVVLDGRPLGQTPRLGVRVSPGRHTVMFINGEKRAVRAFSVLPGATKVISARLK